MYVHSARKEITATASPVLPDGYKDDRFLSRCFYCRPEASHYSSYWLYSILRLSFFAVGYKFTFIIPVIGYVPARKLKVETDFAAVSNTWNYLRKIQVQCRVIDFYSLFLAPWGYTGTSVLWYPSKNKEKLNVLLQNLCISTLRQREYKRKEQQLRQIHSHGVIESKTKKKDEYIYIPTTTPREHEMLCCRVMIIFVLLYWI